MSWLLFVLTQSYVAIRNVRLKGVLLGSSMRFGKRKEIKEKKAEEGQVSLSHLCLSRKNHQIVQLQVGFRRFS